MSVQKDPSYGSLGRNRYPTRERIAQLEKRAEIFIKNGDFNRAIALYKAALIDKKFLLGSSHRDFLKTADVLSAVYASLGDKKRATALLIWAFAPYQQETIDIDTLEPTEESITELLWDTIQRELKSSTPGVFGNIH